MKNGILSYGQKKCYSASAYQNLGDWVQTIAAEYLMKEFGIEEYEYVDRNVAHTYENEDYVFLLYNGFNRLFEQKNYKQNTFPLSDKIIPFFFSMHLHDDCIADDIKEQLKIYGPVGARDEYTMQNLRRQGIPAYLSGCITALLPQRDLAVERSKIYMVDTPDGIEDYIPKEWKEALVYETHKYPLHQECDGERYTTKEESDGAKEAAKKLLQRYRDEAKVVVTSRLHAASPCMAMGIPVILVKNEFDGRFSWIDKYLPLYEKGQWGQIDWAPKPVMYEEEKAAIKECLRQMYFERFRKYSLMYDMSAYYENRNRIEYNAQIRKIIRQLDDYRTMRFAIWGIVAKSLDLCNELSKHNANWKLTKVYDRQVRGCFQGIEVVDSACIQKDAQDVIIVTAPSAHQYAAKLLGERGIPYLLVDFEGGGYKQT